MPLAPGSRLNGYELVRALGRGGMGEVWLATELHLRRNVAVKLLPSELTSDPARVARFHQEARAASVLNHPNVCVIHALGTTSDGLHYIAMEHIESQTLRARLAAGRMTTTEAIATAAQVASALAVAHVSGVVHRDIKPENVMLRRDGIVKVLDFGLAKLKSSTAATDITPTRTAVDTEAGTVVGTVAYMSPEQARGEDIDERTDIWAVGAVLYEMVTGHSPFAARSSSEVLAGILHANPAPLARFEPAAPPELQRIVTKALRKDREQRYQTAKDLLLDLQTLRDDLRTTPASEPSVAVHAQRPGRRVLLAIVLLALALTAWWWRWTGGMFPLDRPRTAPPVRRTLTGLTFGPGLQSDPAWSPDGQSVAYASNVAGNFDIWVQTIGGGEPRQLTRSPADDTQPSWSPTGDRIVFRSEREGGGLFVVPATGGAERQITSFGVYPQWTADGSDILFRSGLFGSTGLHTVPAGGDRPPRDLLESFMAPGTWGWISSHPDGRISAVGLHPRLGHGFFTVTRDGEQITPSQVPSGFPLPVGSGQLSGQGRASSDSNGIRLDGSQYRGSRQ